MILYFLCFARLPYLNADHLREENEDLESLRAEIITWTGLHEERKLRPDLPEQLYTFLRRLLSLDQADRPSAQDILVSIKTGSGLDEISDSRPKSAAHMFDDLSASSRISPVDSPRCATPTRQLSTGFVPPGGPSKLRLSSYKKNRDQHAATKEGNPEINQPISPDSSLVLRGSFPSPTELPEIAPASRPDARRPWDFQTATIQRPLRVALLLLKVVTLNVTCSPRATNPLVAYPLLGIASLDLLFVGSGPAISLTLATLHFAILFGAARANVACIDSFEYLNSF